MKRKLIKARFHMALFALCATLFLMPATAHAASSATETADFTTGDGAAAIQLLNEFKTTDAVNSTWDNETKTLTLKGIDFTTTAAPAVRVPSGSTIVLADGTANSIKSGDMVANVEGDYKSPIYTTALDAVGSLTIQGSAAGTGTLSVISGSYTNTGDAWTWTSGITVGGDFTVKGGQITAQGGAAQANGICFSVGVNMNNDTKNKVLLITGGSLTAIGGESYDTNDGGDRREEFSRGVYVYRGNVRVSGNGKLAAQSVSSMAGARTLSNGLYISCGDLFIANDGEVSASGAYGVEVSQGGIVLDSGKLVAASTQTPGDWCEAIWVAGETTGGTATSNASNITVNGGTLETLNGGINISTYQATETQGLFTVAGGSVDNEGRLAGAKKIILSGGIVQSQKVTADELTISDDAALTIREPVKVDSYMGDLYASSALELDTLTVNGGTLDIAWDWGSHEPVVFPVDNYYGYATPLVKMVSESASATFNGGVTTLNAIGGNTALKLDGQLVLGTGMVEVGAIGNHYQKDQAPVQFMPESLVGIRSIALENVVLSGDKPQANAAVCDVDTGKYSVDTECWLQQEKNAQGIPQNVAYWYSNESYYQDGSARIDTFEKGKSYFYRIYLKAQGDNTFSQYLTKNDITLNGWSMTYGYWVDVSDDGKTCVISYGFPKDGGYGGVADVSCNGVTNIVDAQIAYDIATNVFDSSRDDYDFLCARADVSGDNVIDAQDAFRIQYAALLRQ